MSQPPQFFVDHKRGEVNEIKAILRNPKAIKDPAKKREVIKKVIAYMTLGIDVSRIFGEMIMAANTKDLVQKKMVYHYLCSYAAQKSDMAILAINTLQNDCRDEDPMTRGLALRSLCSLRLPNMTEYVMLPIRKGLNDPSPYVRANAVTGVAKLFRTCPESVKGSDLVDILYNMLKDKDSMVITDVINALNEVLATEGGMVFNTQIVTYLLNRLRDFHEWGQCTVLDLVAKYTPSSDKEMFDIMNLLEDRLKHSNSAVVMGTTKVFLNFTRNMPSLHKEVFKRLRPPMLTLMGSGGVELAYCVLSHIQVLVNREPGIFDEEYKHFFVKFNDPLCLKKLKLDVLSSLANGKNFADILNELAEYVTDVNMEIARASIRNVGKISLRIPAAVDEAIEHLLGFLDLNIEYVSGESIVALRDLLRRYPERSEEVVPNLANFLKGVDYEAEGKSAVVDYWRVRRDY
jgi:AP-4 complex subunit beta-1